jgi:hypothetical protein
MIRKKCVGNVTLKLLAALSPVWVNAQGIYIGAGANLVANGNVKIVLNNAGLVTNGNFTAGQSNVIFSGTTNSIQPFVGGNSTASFNDVTINRFFNKVVLSGDITIQGVLTLTQGNVELNNHTLDLITTGSITGEKLTSRITGVSGGAVRKTIYLSAPQAINPGNIGIAITSAASLGQTVITRTHVPQPMPNGATGIKRVFSITPANNTAVNGTIRFNYTDAEFSGVSESNLGFWTRANVGSNWLLMKRDSINTTSNFVIESGIENFGEYTLAPEIADEKLTSTTNTVTRVSTTTNDQKVLPYVLQTSAHIYPNPLQEQFVVEITGSHDKEFVIGLYNQYGQLLQTKKTACKAGVNRIPWNMSSYANGIYYLVFENEGMKSIKVVKQ